MSLEEIKQKLVQLYQEMYDLTKNECAHVCRVPHSCCDPMYCQVAKEYAKDCWDIDLQPYQQNHPKLPFMGEKGCVVAPHLRPSCTMHTCEINSLGCKRGDMKWTERYFELRAKIADLEEDLFVELDIG